MTEGHNFHDFNVQITCRACLRVPEELFPMTELEINAFQSFTNKASSTEESMIICLVCRWSLRKCMRFIEQCRRANNIISQNLKLESNLYIIYPQVPTNELRISTICTCYVGPEMDFIEDKIEYPTEDLEDDDEIPLVMLQDEFKRSRECEIKIESEIKEENEDYTESKVKKKKKEPKVGFSSRMVQETDEYIVIKLTPEQVQTELSEKSKTDSYLRSPYKCEKCVKGFNFQDVLQSHMVKHSMENGSYRCDICTQYCPNAISLRGHIKSHTTRYKCKLCGQVRLSRQHLLEHHAIVHTNAANTYTCDKCHFITNKRTVIQRHVKTHSVSERHSCHRCGKSFNTIESLRVHTMRHDKTNRLQCKLCDKHFIYPSLLHKHTVAVHERKDYYCVECDVSFKSPESLKLHFKKAKRHRDPSSYKYECSDCPQKFVASASLAVHLSTTHGRPKQYSCDLCRRQYSSKEALRAHNWRVHTHKENVQCHVCDKIFTRKSGLKVHMRSHAVSNQSYTSEDIKNQKQENIITSNIAVFNMALEG